MVGERGSEGEGGSERAQESKRSLRNRKAGGAGNIGTATATEGARAVFGIAALLGDPRRLNPRRTPAVTSSSAAQPASPAPGPRRAMHLLWSPAADASVRALAVLLRIAQVHANRPPLPPPPFLLNRFQYFAILPLAMWELYGV